jgi:hypothetical protein
MQFSVISFQFSVREEKAGGLEHLAPGAPSAHTIAIQPFFSSTCSNSFTSFIVPPN